MQTTKNVVEENAAQITTEQNTTQNTATIDKSPVHNQTTIDASNAQYVPRPSTSGCSVSADNALDPAEVEAVQRHQKQLERDIMVWYDRKRLADEHCYAVVVAAQQNVEAVSEVVGFGAATDWEGGDCSNKMESNETNSFDITSIEK